MFIQKRIFILFMSCIIYLMVYYRRIRGEREVKISRRLEKILFPFSAEGRAALFSIFMAVYLPIALLISYVVMLFPNVSVYSVNYTWYMCTVGILFIACAADIFYELPFMRGKKPLKFIVAVCAVFLILMGILNIAGGIFL